MGKFKLYIGGSMAFTANGQWFYIGGKCVTDEVDVDRLSWYGVLDMCDGVGYKDIDKLWYDPYCGGLGSKENLKPLTGKSFNDFITYALKAVEVNIYVEHGSEDNSYFGKENPKEMCKKLGIGQHGESVIVESLDGESLDGDCLGDERVDDDRLDNDDDRLGDDERSSDDDKLGNDERLRDDDRLGYDSSKGKRVVGESSSGERLVGESSKRERGESSRSFALLSDDLSEFDGYESRLGENEYEFSDNEMNDPCGDNYWVDIPYLSGEDDEEVLMAKEKKNKFKNRKAKKKKRVVIEEEDGEEGPDEGVDDVGLDDDVGVDGGMGIDTDMAQEDNEVGPDAEEGHLDADPNEFVNEIRREIERRMERRNKTRAAEQQQKSNTEESYISDGSFLTSSSDEEADHAVVVPYRRPRFKKGEAPPIFATCMVFPNKKEFKKAVVCHAIHFRRDVRYMHDEKLKCRAVCRSPECKWVVYCSWDKKSKSWMVKTYKGYHSCKPKFTVRCMTYKHLAEWFIANLGKMTLKFSVTEMKLHYHKQTRMRVSSGQCRYARKVVVSHYIGHPLKEFARLEDYVEELKRSNPDSTIVLDAPDGVFKRMYVCFAGVRQGFNTACRKIIGLDGCFLKGPFKGEILSAVGRDPNDQIYPLAWAVVGYECKESWKWFLELLMVDLNVADGNYIYGNDGQPTIARGQGLTFMSDQQKGLLAAINELMPAAVSRRCARHIFAKWRKTHTSEDLHIQFWIVCKAATPKEFFDELEVLGGMSTEAMSDFLEIPHEFWCKAFQTEESKSDIVDNNMSETFNSLIIESRYMSIVTLFETIRKIVFLRFNERKKFLGKFKGDFGPNIWKKIDKNLDESGKYTVDSNGSDGYEVYEDADNKWIVSLNAKKCSCRIWELTGIPCEHVIAVLDSEGLKVDGFVSDWYKKNMFEMAYKNPIQPVEGKKFWPRNSTVVIEAPSFTKFPGRPRKLRKKEGWETSKNGTKMSHKLRKMSCSICQKPDHRANKCTQRHQAQASQTAHSSQPSRPAQRVQVSQPVQASQPVTATSQPAQAAQPAVKRRKTLCGFCKVEGHRRDVCPLNPTSRRFVSQSSTQLASSQATHSQPRFSQDVPSHTGPTRTQQLFQALRESCGVSSTKTRGRKKAVRGRGSGRFMGYGCFVAETGWTCYNPNTPFQRVLDVPARGKSRSRKVIEGNLARIRGGVVGSQGSNVGAGPSTL